MYYYWTISASVSHLALVFNPVALRNAKIDCNFGLSECNKVQAVENKPAIAAIYRPHSLGRVGD